jgi:hypothetical protein
VLHTLYNDKLIEITDDVKNLKLKSNLVLMFAPDDTSIFLVQNRQDVSFYTIVFDENEGEEGEVVVKHMLDLNRIKTLSGKLHSTVSSDMSRSVFLVDEKNFYKYDIQEGTTLTYYNHKVQGMYFLDNNYCYTMSHCNKAKGHERRSGLRLYDLNNLMNLNSDNSYHLTNIQVGCNSKIDFSRSNFRLTIQKNMSELVIIPTLHRNTLSMIGMT